MTPDPAFQYVQSPQSLPSKLLILLSPHAVRAKAGPEEPMMPGGDALLLSSRSSPHGFLKISCELKCTSDFTVPICAARMNLKSTQMIQSIQFRRSSFLLEPDWRERPWDHHEKDYHQRLYDYGFELGALQNRIDDAGLQRGELTTDNAEIFLGDLNRCHAGIDAWYQEFLSASPSPLYWIDDVPSGSMPEEQTETASEHDDSPMPGPFVFPNLRLATATISYWGLKIAIAATLRQLLNEMMRSSPSPRPASTLSKQRDPGPAQQPPKPEKRQPQTAFTFAEPQFYFSISKDLPSRTPLTPLPTHPSTSRSSPSAANFNYDPVTLATQIMRAMPFCLSDEQGMLGAQQSLFPLRVALFILRLHPGMELRWCQNIYRIMDERKGLRYANEIAKLDGGHGTRGNERRKGVTPANTPPPRPEVGPYTVAQAGDDR